MKNTHEYKPLLMNSQHSSLKVTETDKMGLKPIDIGYCICFGQYEHLHTIPYNPFFIVLNLDLCQCEHTLRTSYARRLIYQTLQEKKK